MQRAFASRIRTLYKTLTSSNLPPYRGLSDKAAKRRSHLESVFIWQCHLLSDYPNIVSFLDNGFFLSTIEHRKISHDSKWAHEFLLLNLIHQSAGTLISVVVDRNFHNRAVNVPVPLEDQLPQDIAEEVNLEVRSL